MRLTLRTLLAWIDGVLPPAEREELAGKVAESPVAPKLIERIRQAVEDAPPPPVGGRSEADDPNAVAEYLDNVLPIEQLEPFERHCLESPAALGEVAACHRILADVARHPESVEPLAGDPRRRLIRRVAEGLAHSASERHPATLESEAAAAAAAIASTVEHAPRAKAAAPRGPDEPRASVWAWISAAAAIALLAILGGLLARSIWPSRPDANREVAAVPGMARPEAEGPVADDAAVTPPTEPATPPLAADESESPPAIASASEPPPPIAAVAVPPAATPDAEPVAAAPQGAVPLPHMAASVEAEPPPAEPDVAPPAPPPGRVAAGDPVLRRSPEAGPSRWQPRFAGDVLAANEELLAPALSYPVLERGDLRIRLLPGTQALVSTDGDGTPRLEILFGRGVVWTDAAAGLTVGVTAGGLSGRGSLGPRQPIAIDVRLTHQPGDDPAVVGPGQVAEVFATGGVEWRQMAADGRRSDSALAGIEPTQPMPPRSSLRWNSTTPAQARLERDQAEPGWLRPQSPSSRTERAAAAAIARCLAAVPADGSITGPLNELARDRRAENRAAAASTLALVGEFDDLVRLLCADDDALRLRESQWNTLVADTIPLALGRGANAAARLKNAFLSQAPAGRGEQLFRLACGLSAAERGSGGVAVVVDALADPLLVVRRFAAAALSPLADGAVDAHAVYRPDRAASLNQQGISWWRARVKALEAEAAAVP